MIEIQNLTKHYGPVTAVSNLDVSIDRGELIGFIGPNGAGKTTTLKCLTTLIKPTSGSIRFNGHDIFSSPEQARQRIGYLPEETPLIEELSVREYLHYRMKLKVGNGESRLSVEDCLATCDLNEVASRSIQKLSKGYRQRVGIAEALGGKPEILLLDEPTSGLDPDQIIKIRNLLVSLKENHTLIVSSHILSELELICDRFLIIAGGRVKACGTKERIIAQSNGRQHIHLGLESNEPDIVSKLEQCPSIESVTQCPNEPFSFILSLTPGSPPPWEPITRLLRNNPGTITHLELKQPNLESLYLELTRE